jgi:Golgi phosphoprotein 3 (GPP34)
MIAHRDWDGKPLLSPRLMGLALAGAVLCELAMLERVGERDGDLIILNDTPVVEQVTGTVLQKVLGEPAPLPVKDWVAYLASDSVTAVAGRLVRAGVVRASKRLRGVRYVPVDGTAAFFTAGRLAVMLENGSQFSLPEATLVGLVDAAGLLEQLPTVKPAANRARLAAVVQSLTWPLDGLVAATAGVVENAILTGRT